MRITEGWLRDPPVPVVAVPFEELRTAALAWAQVPAILRGARAAIAGWTAVTPTSLGVAAPLAAPYAEFCDRVIGLLEQAAAQAEQIEAALARCEHGYHDADDAAARLVCGAR